MKLRKGRDTYKELPCIGEFVSMHVHAPVMAVLPSIWRRLAIVDGAFMEKLRETPEEGIPMYVSGYFLGTTYAALVVYPTPNADMEARVQYFEPMKEF